MAAKKQPNQSKPKTLKAETPKADFADINGGYHNMRNVVSLQIAKFAKAAETKGVPRIPVEFDDGGADIIRLTQDDEVLRLDDPVVFGATAGPKIRAMLAAMGQTQIPETFAELFGMHRLGIEINAIRLGIEDSVPEGVQAYVLAQGDKDIPGFSTLLLALKDGRMADAQQWHKDQQSMRYWADWFKRVFAGHEGYGI